MLSLNGMWEVGLNRKYDDQAAVPGLVTLATRATEGSLWYKKEITFPQGPWTRATLLLFGAKYRPRVYINGILVSHTEGGLTLTRHFLDTADVFPGSTVTLEIELASFKDTPDTDASKLPVEDNWRSDLSSHIWNDVYLDLHNYVRIDSVVTSYDKASDSLEIRYKTTAFAAVSESIRFTLFDGQQEIAHTEVEIVEKGLARLALHGKCKLWSPESPTLYTLKAEVQGATHTQKIGIKILEKDYPRFKLNGAPITLRMGSICWHRWQRDEQAKEIAYDETWFLEHILLPLKRSGANTVRFHLGPPPEKFIDLCDEYGMLVQAEWSFFHSLEASAESLKEQWTNWLDMTLRHVSIALVHPWNEIFECQKLADARQTLYDIIGDYPSFILSHRDAMHIHKYWWSMFENVGIYYDSAEQFAMPILADEFGGNYLDYDYNPGKYPELIPAFLRFLGQNNSTEDRKWLQKVSHAKIAEYWRRVGVAGFAPFCMLSSPEDGSTYFEGNLKDGKFKPVFDELKAAYSPISVSMDLWDRNFYPSQKVTVPLHLFNDTQTEQALACSYGVEGQTPQGEIRAVLPPHSKKITEITLEIPSQSGEFTLCAAVGEAVSRWDIIVTRLDTENISRTIGILPEETELLAFVTTHKIPYTHELAHADVILGLERTYELLKQDKTVKTTLEKALANGISVALLGMGPKHLGEGYEADSIDRIQKVRRVNVSELDRADIVFDIGVSFKGTSEPESCVHRTEHYGELWENIDRKSTWLWNGLRGGLIVPAVDMAVVGNDKESFEKLWQSKGADINAIKSADYFAYELEGYYRYSTAEDESVQNALRDHVRFVVEDAPSLKDCINTEAEIAVTNLHKIYTALPSSEGKVRYIDLLKAGKKLLRTPAVIVEFERGKGKLLLSQIMVDGRLANDAKGFFDLRNDAAAAQLIVNIIKNF